MDRPQTPPTDDLAVRRKRAVRTALVVAVIAVAVYAGFLILGAMGS